MGDFKKFGGNKQKGGGIYRSSGGRQSFGDDRPSFRGGDRGEREMFKATCAKCGRPCEVPFRPSGDRPVYCKDCFQAMGPQDRGDRVPSNFQKRDNAPRQDFSPRPFRGAPQQGSGEDKRLDDLKIQLATVVSKLDKLLNILGTTAHTAPKAAQTNSQTLRDTIVDTVSAPTAKKKTPTVKKKSSGKKK